MNDLLSDLEADLAAAPAAPSPPRPALPLPTAPPRRTTPAFELRITPLRWCAPGFAFDAGLCLRLGPVQVGVARR